MQNCGMPPPLCKLGRKSDLCIWPSPNFVPKTGLHFSETNHYAIRASNLMCQSAVFKSNQCEKRNPVHQRFDVRNWDGAVDTSKNISQGYYMSYPFIPTNPLLATMSFFVFFSFFFVSQSCALFF